jgi:hypothetical protein
MENSIARKSQKLVIADADGEIADGESVLSGYSSVKNSRQLVCYNWLAMAIKFTNHARNKFAVLARHGFNITEEDVIDVLTNPDKIEDQRQPPIAQKVISDRHVLRVVFRTEGDDEVVITFYPGRRRQYED